MGHDFGGDGGGWGDFIGTYDALNVPQHPMLDALYGAPIDGTVTPYPDISRPPTPFSVRGVSTYRRLQMAMTNGQVPPTHDGLYKAKHWPHEGYLLKGGEWYRPVRRGWRPVPKLMPRDLNLKAMKGKLVLCEPSQPSETTSASAA